MTVKLNKVAERLEEIVDFEFSKPLTPRAREDLTVTLCRQFLEPLSEVIEKCDSEEEDEDEEEAVEDNSNIIKTMAEYFASQKMTKIIRQKNLKCNGVMPFISAVPVPEWEQRDVAVVVSFGFPKKVPASLRARKRSNKLLEVIASHIELMFSGRSVTEVEHNTAAKVPYLLCVVDDVSVIIKISIKPFCSAQYLSKDVVEMYRKHDDRFITLANYFHQYLKSKIVNKRDVRKAKSVIPKLCTVKMMFIHFFKHYNLLPADPNSLEGMMNSLNVSTPDPLSLGTLYFAFLDYYLEVVSLETDYLEITSGEVIEKKSIGLTNLNILSISDIFDDHFPGERVNDILIFKRILKASFNSIKKYLTNRTGNVLNDLRVIPLRPKNVEL